MPRSPGTCGTEAACCCGARTIEPTLARAFVNALLRLAAALAFAATFGLPRGARRRRSRPPEELEDPRDRTEWAGFPVIGGSTDIGVQLGAAGAITHLGDRFKPYWWKVDALVSMSVKGGPRGTEIVQQSHDMRWDLPGGGGGKVRLMPAVFYDRTVNSGYFGLGNASRSSPPERQHRRPLPVPSRGAEHAPQHRARHSATRSARCTAGSSGT